MSRFERETMSAGGEQSLLVIRCYVSFLLSLEEILEKLKLLRKSYYKLISIMITVLLYYYELHVKYLYVDCSVKSIKYKRM